MHELAFPLLVGLILVALAFDFLNGLHDAANSIATVVATRLLKPVHAVVFAAAFNFAAYFLSLAFPALHKVAETIGAGLIDKDAELARLDKAIAKLGGDREKTLVRVNNPNFGKAPEHVQQQARDLLAKQDADLAQLAAQRHTIEVM